MNDHDYFKGAWEEFRKWEAQEHDRIRDDIKDLSHAVESLKLWKASVVGMAGLMGALMGLVASYLHSLHLGVG